MRRLVVLVSAVVLCSLLTFGLQPHAMAQEATPVTEVTLEGATIEAGAFAPVPGFPSEPAEIGILRVRFAPGGRLLVPAGDPGMAMHFLDSGTITIRFSAPVVIRGEAQTQEEIPANTTFTLRAGDAFVAPGPSGGEYRNDGSEDAVMWFAPGGTHRRRHAGTVADPNRHKTKLRLIVEAFGTTLAVIGVGWVAGTRRVIALWLMEQRW